LNLPSQLNLLPGSTEVGLQFLNTSGGLVTSFSGSLQITGYNAITEETIATGVVPEPSALIIWLLLAAIVAVGGFRKRRRKDDRVRA
jgi:hypothetical protein